MRALFTENMLDRPGLWVRIGGFNQQVNLFAASISDETPLVADSVHVGQLGEAYAPSIVLTSEALRSSCRFGGSRRRT